MVADSTQQQKQLKQVQQAIKGCLLKDQQGLRRKYRSLQQRLLCQLPAWAEPDEDELERWHERVERYVCAMRGAPDATTRTTRVDCARTEREVVETAAATEAEKAARLMAQCLGDKANKGGTR